MQEVSSLFGSGGGSSVVNTRVSVVFTNQNPVVQDVIVRFNFLVELLCVNAKPLIDTPLSSLYDGIDNVPVFRGGELIGSQPLQSSLKCGNPTAAEMVKGSDSYSPPKFKLLPGGSFPKRVPREHSEKKGRYCIGACKSDDVPQ